MDKFSFINLWDAYNALLTSTQQEITALYFNLDLTVSEIAAEKGISRQAVSDCLKGCKKQLEEYEEKLHILKNAQSAKRKYSRTVEAAHGWAESFAAAHPEFTEEVKSLSAILSKDCPSD